MSKLLIYKASAGSGKTHTLVMHYITWALRAPQAFKTILAATFTNQATKEIKERIIAHLHSLSLGEETMLWHHLRHLGWQSQPLQERSQIVLKNILYQYNDFSITTIDRFFHQIIQSSARELGLPQGFSIEMDESSALQEVIEALLSSPDPLLQQWIVDFALNKLWNGKNWQIKDDLQNIGQALFTEAFKIHEKNIVASCRKADTIPRCIATLQSIRYTFEEKMAKIGKHALVLLQNNGYTASNFSYGIQGVIGYFIKIADKKAFIPTKRARRASQSIQYWLPETAKTAALTTLISTQLQPLLREAIALYEQEWSTYQTAILLSRHSYTMGIITFLLKGLARYRAKHQVLFISDIAALLYPYMQDNETPFLYERIGGALHHLLIDEFQDLSIFQWTNIKPLLHNSLAEGHGCLLVGDVKQAIYRWRGSDWRVFNHQVEATFYQTKGHLLATNRRSQEAIVLFNNYFFSNAFHKLISHLAASNGAITSLYDEWMQLNKVYNDLTQQAVDHPYPSGYVACLFLKKKLEAADYTWQNEAQRRLSRYMATLQQEGFSKKDMVILVRNNREVACIEQLQRTATGKQGSSTLWDHIAIKLLIQTLYYLHDRQNPIYKMAWNATYCSYIGKKNIGVHELSTTMDQLLPHSFWKQRRFLQNISIDSCVALLIPLLFKENYSDRDILWLFQSILLDHCRKEPTTLTTFLNWWEKRGKSIPLPTIDHSIPVMTVHQAKGLEFNIVLIPFCNWELDHITQHGPILWSAPKQSTPFHHFPTWPINYGPNLKDTHYAHDYYLEYMQIHLDNLNLLYVAFTRAKERLYIIAPEPTKREEMTTTANLLYQSLHEPIHPLPSRLIIEKETLANESNFRITLSHLLVSNK